MHEHNVIQLGRLFKLEGKYDLKYESCDGMEEGGKAAAGGGCRRREEESEEKTRES